MLIELSQVTNIRTRSLSPLVINRDCIASLRKSIDDVSGDTIVTLKDGQTFVVDESIKTIMARCQVQEDDE